MCERVQEEVDDLIHDEAEEVADAEDALRTHRQVDLRERRDMTNEEVERYIKERFEEPALREAQLRDDGAQAGARHHGSGLGFICIQVFADKLLHRQVCSLPSPCNSGAECEIDPELLVCWFGSERCASGVAFLRMWPVFPPGGGQMTSVLLCCTLAHTSSCAVA